MALALIFVSPFAPQVAASEPATCVDVCAWLPLYVTLGSEPHPEGGSASGFSSLPGDAMPTDPESYTTGRVRAITREIDGITLAKTGTFRWEIASPDDYDFVRGHVAVYTYDAMGARLTLAQKVFAPPNETLGVHIARVVEQTPADVFAAGCSPPYVYVCLGPDTSPIRRAAEGHLYNASANISRAVSGMGAPAGLATQQAYATLCGNTAASRDAVQCRAVTGRPLIGGAFAVCESSSLPALRTAVNTADAAARVATGHNAVCYNRWENDVRPAAAAADGQLQGLASNVTALVIGAFNATGSAIDTVLPNASAPLEEWRNGTLDASVPSWMAQDGDVFRLPSGFRLALEIDLDGLVQNVNGNYTAVPLVIEYGRDDARTALAIRHATPQSFATFSHAEWIGSGSHSGHFAEPTEARDHRFLVSPTHRINLTVDATDGAYELYDSDGARISMGSGVFSTASAAVWVLRVLNTQEDLTSEYSFTLRFEIPETDEGRFLPSGSAFGALGPGDDVDTYTLFAWKAQRFTIELQYPSGARYHLNATGMPEWDVTRTTQSASESYTARSTITGYFSLRILRDFGEGAYSLQVTPEAAGNHTNVPTLSPVLTAATLWLHGHADGVYFTQNSTTKFYSPTSGVTPVVDGTFEVQGITTSGALLRTSAESGKAALSLDDGTVVDPLARPGQAVFGGDGAVYGHNNSVSGIGGHIYRIDADRSLQRFPNEVDGSTVGSVRDILASPDGSVHVVASNATYRFDVAAGVLVPEPSLAGILAFDIDGGRYRILNSTLIERIDPTTGRGDLVARSDRALRSLATAGPFVYASTFESISVAPLDHAGFPGFEPAFRPPRAPDLRVVSITDAQAGVALVPLSELHITTVNITNVGGSSTRVFELEFWVESTNLGPLTAPPERRPIDPLAPGETRALNFAWNSGAHVGEGRVRVWLDGPISENVVESNETNNIVYADVHAWIGGVPQS